MSSINEQRLQRDFKDFYISERPSATNSPQKNYPYQPRNSQGYRSKDGEDYDNPDIQGHSSLERGSSYSSGFHSQEPYGSSRGGGGSPVPYSQGGQGYPNAMQGNRSYRDLPLGGPQSSYQSVSSYHSEVRSPTYSESVHKALTEVKNPGQGVQRSYVEESSATSPDGSYVTSPGGRSIERQPQGYGSMERQSSDSGYKYPQGVSSKILCTTPVQNVTKGLVESRPTNQGGNSEGNTYSPTREHHEPVYGGALGPRHQSPYSPRKSGSEAQVDALTNLLMQNMEASTDPDFYGMCAKCGGSIMGEKTGCTALDQLFHIDCFICNKCDNSLGGQPFFALEEMPYCEVCYLDTLEKCNVCAKPITDRLLRATGKPYHPRCFICCECGISLDGIPFTVDSASKIHCIEDFHRKFAPRCYACQRPILPDPKLKENVRIVALDKSFHVQCYKCEHCGVQLSSNSDGNGCYPLDDHILCQNCNAKWIQQMTSKMTTEL